jgi:hypothetical protein
MLSVYSYAPSIGAADSRLGNAPLELAHDTSTASNSGSIVRIIVDA